MGIDEVVVSLSAAIGKRVRSGDWPDQARPTLDKAREVAATVAGNGPLAVEAIDRTMLGLAREVHSVFLAVLGASSFYASDALIAWNRFLRLAAPLIEDQVTIHGKVWMLSDDRRVNNHGGGLDHLGDIGRARFKPS